LIYRESTEKNEQLSEVVRGSKQFDLENSTKISLLNILNKNNSHKDNSIIITSVYPRFVHARAKGSIIEIEAFKTSSILFIVILRYKLIYKFIEILKIKESYNYYVDTTFSFANKSTEFWWNVYDTDSKSYRPPCNS
jgi:hypothetical protein